MHYKNSSTFVIAQIHLLTRIQGALLGACKVLLAQQAFRFFVSGKQLLTASKGVFEASTAFRAGLLGGRFAVGEEGTLKPMCCYGVLQLFGSWLACLYANMLISSHLFLIKLPVPSIAAGLLCLELQRDGIQKQSFSLH